MRDYTGDTMFAPDSLHDPERSQLAESLLKISRFLGMLGFLGGLAALGSMWAFGSPPRTQPQWELFIGLMRPVFFSCVFMGIVILAFAGTMSWWRHRRKLHRSRWFRVMIVLLLIAVPTLHLSARSIAMQLYAAVDANHLDDAARLWNQLGKYFAIGFIVMLAISAIGILKPTLGQSQSASKQ